MKVIPQAAWAVALVLALVVAGVVWASVIVPPGGPRPLGLLLLVFIPAIFSIYILIIGYIVSDARRRGMPVLLWTLLAIFTPSAIGIILYFILRRPLVRACAQCGTLADAAYAFCPSCGATLGKTCPSCRISVESSWLHCAKCGTRLTPA
jgi:RNA polymerase subunit RPABC4/transcription elongation factor Spt4